MKMIVDMIVFEELNQIPLSISTDQNRNTLATSVACGMELLEDDDDAWLKFTFPFLFIRCVGAVNVVMIFFKRGLWKENLIEGSLTEMTSARILHVSQSKCVAHQHEHENI